LVARKLLHAKPPPDMSYFSRKLEALLDKNCRENEVNPSKAIDLVRAAKLPQSVVSRWINGEQIHISEEDWASLSKAITDDPKARAELLAAHLMDYNNGPGSEMVSITVAGSGASHKSKANEILKLIESLPPKEEETLLTLLPLLKISKLLRDHLSSLANLLQTKSDLQKRLGRIPD